MAREPPRLYSAVCPNSYIVGDGAKFYLLTTHKNKRPKALFSGAEAPRKIGGWAKTKPGPEPRLILTLS
jgi:hypothetical protein